MGIFNRKKREEKQHRKEERQEQLKRVYQKSIDTAKADMLNTPCAMREGFNNCTDQCIHFKEGYIYNEHFRHELGVDMWLSHKLPKCRCWKD